MAPEHATPGSPLPIDCRDLSLKPLRKEIEELKQATTPVTNHGIRISENVRNEVNHTAKFSNKNEHKTPKLPLEAKPAPIIEKSHSKRRSSLVSQNPPAKVHKRKQNWEFGKAAIKYYDETKKKFTLGMLRTFIVDVIRSNSIARTCVFRAELHGKVKNMTVVFVSGLLESDLKKAETQEQENLIKLEQPKVPSLLFLHNTFEYMIPMSLPANKESLVSPINVLLKQPLTKKQKEQRKAESKLKQLLLYDLLLTEVEMRDNNYPIHSSIDNSPQNELPNGWKETLDFKHDGSHTFAVDCEFCDAASGKVLTRISIVDFQEQIVYDTFVKPAEEILDYKTRYSGITEEVLRDVTTTLQDVQTRVLSIVSSSDVLIGHSLESDLKVLRIRHPRLVDSALVYDHHMGYPHKPGLKSLSEQYLGRNIQKGEADGTGHSSVEDLIASLDLVKLKLVSGPHFGRNSETALFSEGIKASNSKARIIDSNVALYNSILKDCDCVDICPVSNDTEALEIFKTQSEDYFFNLVWLKDLKNLLCKEEESSSSGEEDRVQSKRECVLLETGDKLKQIYDTLPSGSIFVVCSDGGNVDEINKLQSIRKEFQKQLRAGLELTEILGEVWDFEKQSRLFDAVNEARQAMALFTIKE